MQIVVKEAAHTHPKLEWRIGIMKLKQPCVFASFCENILCVCVCVCAYVRACEATLCVCIIL
jgi:hypothetical protein